MPKGQLFIDYQILGQRLTVYGSSIAAGAGVVQRERFTSSYLFQRR